MDKLDINRNSTQYYGGIISGSLASHEGCLTFRQSMKGVYLILELQGDTLKVLCSIFEKPVTYHENNRGEIAFSVSPKMKLCTNHIAIKYHHFRSLVANGDVHIQHIDTKEHIADTFTKPLDYGLFGYLCYKLNGW